MIVDGIAKLQPGGAIVLGGAAPARRAARRAAGGTPRGRRGAAPAPKS